MAIWSEKESHLKVTGPKLNPPLNEPMMSKSSDCGSPVLIFLPWKTSLEKTVEGNRMQMKQINLEDDKPRDYENNKLN